MQLFGRVPTVAECIRGLFNDVHAAVQPVQTHAQKQGQKLGAQFDQIMAMLQGQSSCQPATKRLGEHAKVDKKGDPNMSLSKSPLPDDHTL